MPDLLKIASDDWTLTVWSKDVSAPRGRLLKTLAARSGVIPDETVRAGSAVVDFLDTAAPVFFENRPYEFEFAFKEGVRKDPEPEILHRLRSVTDAFHFKHGKYLVGTINFGNDAGWFRIVVRHATDAGITESPISLLVLPTKMDLQTDMNAILTAVDRQYPLWRFSISGKTEQELAESRKPHERFPLLWLAQFTGLREQLEEAVKRILEAPHSRLLENERRIKADRLKGRLPARIEQALAEDIAARNYDERYRIIEKRLSTDTPENRFVKMVLVQCHRAMAALHLNALGMNDAPENQLLSTSFIEQLENWKYSLERLKNRPFFSEIGTYSDNGRESLVLHNRLGYSRVYRIWQKLKLYLDVLGSGNSISLKSMDELYEVWCFLAIKDMLVDELGFTESLSTGAKLQHDSFEKQLIDGRQAAFEFTSPAGVKVRLSHEPQFTRRGGNDGMASFTTVQKPDIFLEADFPDGTSLSWVFDAKYRIAEDADELDKVPEDAINQMHRYRDAMIYRQGNGGGYWSKSRPVFGAFALYPGAVDEQSASNRYDDWISEVGIGAFPLLPGSPNGWLLEFLRSRLQYSGNMVADAEMFTDRLYSESPARIPVRGMKQIRHEGLTALIKTGSRRSRVPAYYQALEEGRAKWIHVRMKAVGAEERNALDEMRYAVPCYALPGGALSGEWCYPVLSAEVVKRDRISAIQSGSRENNPANTSDYLLIELGVSFRLGVPVDGNFGSSEFFKLTVAEDLRVRSGRPVIDRRYAFFGEK
jgi:predicted component of viral defense system (DUF524 family)